MIPDFWEKSTDPEFQRQSLLLRAHFKDILLEKGGIPYPEIPALSLNSRKRINSLDAFTFHDYLQKLVGGHLHPHLEEYIEHYCWTAMGGSSTEASAAAGLNFMVGDSESITVFPGGNGAIAEATFERLLKDLGPSFLRPSSLVFDVQVRPEGVVVSYLDSHNQVRKIQAQKVVMACPKFVAAYLIDDLEAERVQAIRSVKYRAYLVANALVNRPIRSLSNQPFFDVFLLNGKIDSIKNHVKELAQSQKATDFITADFATPHPEKSVLTLFRTFPYEGGRAEVFGKGAYEKFRDEFEEQVTQSILPLFGVSENQLVDLRITRWGHPLPFPEAGSYSSGRVDLLRKPFREKVFFVEQDNWVLPCFETAFHEAKTWAEELRR